MTIFWEETFYTIYILCYAENLHRFKKKLDLRPIFFIVLPPPPLIKRNESTGSGFGPQDKSHVFFFTFYTEIEISQSQNHLRRMSIFSHTGGAD